MGKKSRQKKLRYLQAQAGTEIRQKPAVNLENIFGNKGFLIAVILIAIYISIFSIICINKYLDFEYHDWDLAIYTNVLWNLVHGRIDFSLFQENFLHEHASLIAFLVAIPYFIFRHPVFLIILQTAALGISAFPVFLLARRKLDDLAAVIITLMFLLYPAIHYANLYEFNFETLSVPFLSFAFYFLITNKKALCLLMCIGACSCKENIPLTIAALGVFGLLRPRRRLLGAVILVLGIAWFFFDIRLMQSMASTQPAGGAETGGANLKYIFIFNKYGNNLREIFFYLLSHPYELFKELFSSPAKLWFFFDLFGIFLFLPFLRPDILLINIPHILARMLASNTNEHTIYYHSAAALAPFVLFAFIFSIGTLLKKIPGLRAYRYVLLTSVLMVEIISMFYIWHIRPDLAKFQLGKNKYDYMNMLALKKIPRDASIAASLEFLPRLANRDSIYSIHNMFGTSPFKWAPPKDLEYILLDLKSGVLRGTHFESYALLDRNFGPYLSENNFGLVMARNDLMLFKKDFKENDALIGFTSGLGNPPSSCLLKVDNALWLLDFKCGYLQEDDGIVHITFYWYAENDIKADYELVFYIKGVDIDRPEEVHTVGYAIYPTSMWEKGQIIKENYWLALPKLQPGDYRISMLAFNYQKEERAKLEPSQKEKLDQFGKFILTTVIQTAKGRL